jgi:hypothetical protein
MIEACLCPFVIAGQTHGHGSAGGIHDLKKIQTGQILSNN